MRDGQARASDNRPFQGTLLTATSGTGNHLQVEPGRQRR